jgi:RNA polymerase II elongation factor ELL
MPSLIVPDEGLSLDCSQSATKAAGAAPTALGLTLTDGVIEEMIRCVQNGKPIQLSLGTRPVSILSI